MKRDTEVQAENGRQDLTITRDFDLPVDLLFKAHAEADLVEQWMENKVLKLESKKHGSYQFEKKDEQGNVLFSAHGVIHEFIFGQKITLTFEMGNAPFGVQLEIYQFEKTGDETSRLTIHTIFESVTLRDQLLKLPFNYGINRAHNRIQEILTKPK